jgi:hypothetical protein
MIFHSRVAQTAILATGSALASLTATLGDRAHAEGKLDASYTISFARIRVGDISATGVFGESEYAISARGRGLFRKLRTNRRPPRVPACQISFRRPRNGDGARTGRRHAAAGAVQNVGCECARKPSDRGQPVRSNSAIFNGC